MILKQFYLEPLHDSHVSFYKKAIVELWIDKSILYSYGTRVAEYQHIEKGLDKFVIYGLWSHTTIRHIREFASQCGVNNLDLNELYSIIDEKGVYL